MTSTTVDRKTAKIIAADIAEKVGAKGSRVHVGTWMGRPGVSIDILWSSNPTGPRVAIHKWDDETTCKVRGIDGDAWRKPDSYSEYWAAECDFTLDAIAENIGDGAA